MDKEYQDASDNDPPPTPFDGNVKIRRSLLSSEDLMLLAKLEEANRILEADTKSLNSLSGTSCHSRKSSDTSQISLTSVNGSSQDRNEDASEEDQWTLWGRIVNDWESQWKKRNQYIKELVRKGVPHHFRGLVWQLLCGADQSSEKALYSEYMKLSSAYERVIRRDITRTYPEHEFFKKKDGLGQESLFNVMKAYSLHDREVGYCQGSAFIVGLLLMQMPEEDSFSVLVKIMQQHSMRDMYKPSMAMLGLCMYQLENLVQEALPDLFQHFENQNFFTTMYASKWFLTLYASTLCLPVSCRIMDVFLSEGIDIIFKVALALLTWTKDDLLALDMENMQEFFLKELPERVAADPDHLMTLAFNMKIHPRKMKKLEKEYSVKITKEIEEQGEIKRLRNENRALRSTIDHLEVESASLAETLVRWQVDRANGAETEFVLAQQLADAQRRLEVALLAQKEHDQECSRSNSLEGPILKEEDLAQRDDLIQCLQQELIKVRLSEAENMSFIQELKTHINELEEDKKSLRELNVDNSVAHLQEELIAVKLREAEANLALKDLRQRFTDLSESWKKHLESRAEASAPNSDVMSTPKKLFRAWENRVGDAQKREEDMISNRIRDMETLTEMESLRLKVMELEAQVNISTNQLRRQDEEKKTLMEEIDKLQQKERNMISKIKECDHKYSDVESQSKYDLMMANIRKVEDTQRIAELEQEISILRMKNQEILTEGEIRSNLDVSEKERDLQDHIADLKAEIMKLKTCLAKAQGEILPISDDEE